MLAVLACGSQALSFKKLISRNRPRTCRQTRLRLCEGSKSVLPSTCEFAQDELLSQTADDMQTQIYPKSLEYMPGSTI